LRAAPADRLQFVFLLTDGEQDPPPGSPYAAAWNSAWEELAREAQRVTGMRPVRVAIVRLTPEADQHFLARVFPDAISTDAMTASALRGWFHNQTAEAAVEKLLLLIARDLQHRGIEVEPAVVRTFASRPTEVTLQLTSRRQLLSSLIPAGTTLDLPGGGTLRTPSDVTIQPGETRDVVLTLTDAEYPGYLPPGRRTRNIAQQLALQVRPGPTSELPLVGADTALRATPLQVDLTLVGGGALPWSLYFPIAGLIVTLLGAGALGVKWKMHRAYLPGRVIIRPSLEDVAGPIIEEKTEQLRGKRLRRYTVTHADREQILTLEARSERGRTVVYAIPHGKVTLRGKPLTAPHVVRSAATFDTTFGPVTYIVR
jgi:hypothetical protein